jgi:hypothetical protein
MNTETRTIDKNVHEHAVLGVREGHVTTAIGDNGVMPTSLKKQFLQAVSQEQLTDNFTTEA